MFLSRKLRFFVLISAIFLLLTQSVHALEVSSLLGEGRYFVSSENKIVKRLFGARHDFEGGFTTDLTKGELWALRRIFRIDVGKVAFYNVTQNNLAGSLDDLFNFSEEDEEEKVENPEEVIIKRDNLPLETVSWGIKLVYNNKNIVSTSGGDDVMVASLSTGIEEHIDINLDSENCVDFTRSSVVKKTCDDKNGHGTHIAGILAAAGGSDEKGIWGVSPGINLAVYKVCNNEGLCWADDVAKAISYGQKEGVNIITMSFSGSDESILVSNAVKEAYGKNVLLIGAAGNQDPEKEEDDKIGFPASHKEIIAVGSINEEGEVPDWSRRGSSPEFTIEDGDIEFVAPGVNIESTWLDDGYQFLSGTSVSAPFISGLAAKLWDGIATSTRAILQSLAIDVAKEGNDMESGFGLPILLKVVEEDPIDDEEIDTETEEDNEKITLE